MAAVPLEISRTVFAGTVWIEIFSLRQCTSSTLIGKYELLYQTLQFGGLRSGWLCSSVAQTAMPSLDVPKHQENAWDSSYGQAAVGMQDTQVKNPQAHRGPYFLYFSSTDGEKS